MAVLNSLPAAVKEKAPPITAAGIPMRLSALNERALAVRTPSPLGEQRQRPAQQQQEQQLAHSNNSTTTTNRPPLPKRRTRFACCTQPMVLEDQESTGSNGDESLNSLSPASAHQHKKGHFMDALSPKKSLRCQVLTHQSSACYSDAEWFDARSEISSALSSAVSDHAAKLEDLTAMLKDMQANPAATGASPGVVSSAAAAAGGGGGGGTHWAANVHPTRHPAVKGPWVPEPALAFGEPHMSFMPVPAHTGFAAYWLRNPERSTPYPTPVDVMIKASALAMKSHASIPGIWLQETDKGFSVTVKPRFMPPGLPRYTETYDKSNATEPMWSMRRDLRLGTTSGQIFMTTDGMLILRARSKPLFGSAHDFIMEEYMRLEEDGEVIVDRMCCLCIKSGARATQYVVGHRYAVPIRGHV